MNIIIGAGWYGLYIAKFFQDNGEEYIVFEKKNDIFEGASGYNQNRLHLGFHYPRSYITRKQARSGFDIFKQKFPQLSSEIKTNIYAIHECSILDYRSYLSIFRHEGYIFDEIEPIDPQFQGCINTHEEQISPNAAKMYFKDCALNIEYNSNCRLEGNELYVNGKLIKYDRLFDCTWGQLVPIDGYFKENFTTVIVKAHNPPLFDALTIMDGPFFSIFPLDRDEGLYTLTSVKHGVTSCSANISADKSWKEFEAMLPNIAKSFVPVNFYCSQKLKPKEYSAKRAVDIIKRKNVYHILAGKIDAIFELDSLLCNL